MVAMYYTDNGYEIYRTNGSRHYPIFLRDIYKGNFQWTNDRSLALHFNSRKIAVERLVAIKKAYIDNEMECTCTHCESTAPIQLKESNGMWWGMCEKCGAEFWVAR